MNILVIGNGFDLAHGLPTKYADFLEFIKVIKQALSKGKLAGIDWGNTNAEVKNFLISNKGKVQENLFSRKQMWEELIDNNFWMEYFLSVYKKREKEGKNGWIDFESEISGVIQNLENDIYRLSNSRSIDDGIDKLSNNILRKKYSEIIDGRVEYTKGVTYKEVRNQLLIDLNKLIRALEIYLCEYVEKLEIKKKSPDIDALEIDHVLSFNYTNTYEKVYGKSRHVEYDYIHGEADIDNAIESNNMVLGIDEYLPDDRRNKDIEFIVFKKYYQRIQKQTGCKYKMWVDNIRKDYVQYLKKQEEADRREYTYISDSMQRMMNSLAASAIKEEEYAIHNLYIFGHSLDITDKDILCDLILNDNVHTTIFYLNKDVMGQQIANLVKVIGQDELIRRTGGNTKTIEFKLQQPMIPIDKLR